MKKSIIGADGRTAERPCPERRRSFSVLVSVPTKAAVARQTASMSQRDDKSKIIAREALPKRYLDFGSTSTALLPTKAALEEPK